MSDAYGVLARRVEDAIDDRDTLTSLQGEVANADGLEGSERDALSDRIAGYLADLDDETDLGPLEPEGED